MGYQSGQSVVKTPELFGPQNLGFAAIFFASEKDLFLFAVNNHHRSTLYLSGSYKKMKRSVFLAAAIFAISACGVFEEERVYEDLPVGSTVENFRLVDTSGAERSVDELKGKNGAILVFVSAQCPVVKQYNERISEFAADF